MVAVVGWGWVAAASEGGVNGEQRTATACGGKGGGGAHLGGGGGGLAPPPCQLVLTLWVRREECVRMCSRPPSLGQSVPGIHLPIPYRSLTVLIPELTHRADGTLSSCQCPMGGTWLPSGEIVMLLEPRCPEGLHPTGFPSI